MLKTNHQVPRVIQTFWLNKHNLLQSYYLYIYIFLISAFKDKIWESAAKPQPVYCNKRSNSLYTFDNFHVCLLFVFVSCDNVTHERSAFTNKQAILGCQNVLECIIKKSFEIWSMFEVCLQSYCHTTISCDTLLISSKLNPNPRWSEISLQTHYTSLKQVGRNIQCTHDL